jgi:plastocyanin
MRAVVCIAAIAFASSSAAAGPAGKVTGKVHVTAADGKPMAGAEVIVYVVGFSEPPGTEQVTVKQRGRKFVPELVAVTLGGKVNFPNEDAFLHNVFSQSSSRKFDLGSFKKGETKTKEFPAPGVVDVYCNIHPEMAATILVVPNQRHTRTASDGTFSLDGVPPGNWTVFAYTRRATKPVMTKVTVTAGAETKIELAIQRGAEPEHLNKYGEKYRSGTPNTYH